MKNVCKGHQFPVQQSSMLLRFFLVFVVRARCTRIRITHEIETSTQSGGEMSEFATANKTGVICK